MRGEVTRELTTIIFVGSNVAVILTGLLVLIYFRQAQQQEKQESHTISEHCIVYVRSLAWNGLLFAHAMLFHSHIVLNFVIEKVVLLAVM